MECILKITDNCEEQKEFDIFYTPMEYGLEVYVDSIEKFKSLINDKEIFKKHIDLHKEWAKKVLVSGEFYDDDIKCTNFLEKNYDKILEIVDHISLSFETIDTKEFIKEYPMLLNNKLVLDDLLTIVDEEKINELILKYDDMKENVYIFLEGNTGAISLIDCKKTIDEIKEKAEAIKKLGLSPMENIMYLYDQVRNRVYKKEAENELGSKSRDLSQVMFGDEIVCVGYANIMYAVLNYLGIRSRMVFLSDPTNENSGHARNVVYVNDPKYNIDGVYYFDATWDSKNEANKNSFLMIYTYFAKTKSYMSEVDFGSYVESDIPEYSDDMCEILEENLNAKNYEILFKYFTTIDSMSKLALDEKIIDFNKLISHSFTEEEINEILDKFALAYDKYNSEIDAETMIQLFNNVRKIEHYQNEQLYPYSLTAILNAIKTSEFEFSGSYLTVEERFEQIISGQKLSIRDEFIRYLKKSDIPKQMKQIELTKTLRKVRDKKLGK